MVAGNDKVGIGILIGRSDDKHGRPDGRLDGRPDGRRDGRPDGRPDGRRDGSTIR